MIDRDAVFACNMNVFTPDERRAHERVVRKLFGTIQSVRELDSGYAFQLPNSSAALSLAARFIDNERLCCPFFGFNLIVTPNSAELWLHLTGNDGVKPFILAEFDEVLGEAIRRQVRP